MTDFCSKALATFILWLLNVDFARYKRVQRGETDRAKKSYGY